MSIPFAVVVAWHNQVQLDQFFEAWGLTGILPDWLFLEQDRERQGCAKTKNTGILKALEANPEFILILDDDCYPDDSWSECARRTQETLMEFWAKAHIAAMSPQPVKLYETITDPPSRGTPYFNRSITMPCAASMGFWTGIPDYDAATQLAGSSSSRHQHPIVDRKTIWGRFFAFSGMNCAFRAEFWPFFKFDEEHDRFDDIFMGYRLQAEAYRRGYCINTNGPLVRHSRQSNVWANLRTEAQWMELNETEWVPYAKQLTG